MIVVEVCHSSSAVNSAFKFCVSSDWLTGPQFNDWWLSNSSVLWSNRAVCVHVCVTFLAETNRGRGRGWLHSSTLLSHTWTHLAVSAVFRCVRLVWLVFPMKTKSCKATCITCCNRKQMFLQDDRGQHIFTLSSHCTVSCSYLGATIFGYVARGATVE